MRKTLYCSDFGLKDCCAHCLGKNESGFNRLIYLGPRGEKSHTDWAIPLQAYVCCTHYHHVVDLKFENWIALAQLHKLPYIKFKKVMIDDTEHNAYDYEEINKSGLYDKTLVSKGKKVLTSKTKHEREARVVKCKDCKKFDSQPGLKYCKFCIPVRKNRNLPID